MKHILTITHVKKIPALFLMVLLLSGTLLSAVPAGASTIDATVQYSLGNSPWVSYKFSGTTKNWYTEYWLVGDNNTYDAFCIQNMDAYLGEGVYDISAPGTEVYKAAWIAEKYYAQGWSNSAFYNKSEVQSAIWEVLFETSSSYNVASGDTSNRGNFWIKDAKGKVSVSNINTILSSMTTAFTTATFTGDSFPGIKIATFSQSADGMITSDHQDYIYYALSPPGDPNPTPEPATMLLFGVGLIGLAGVIRKKSIN